MKSKARLLWMMGSTKIAGPPPLRKNASEIAERVNFLSKQDVKV